MITLCIVQSGNGLVTRNYLCCCLKCFKIISSQCYSELLDGWIKWQYWKERIEYIWTLVETSVSSSYFICQLSSVTQSCPTLCDPMDCSTPGLPVHHQLPKCTQTHVHWVSDAIQLSHPLSSPSSPTVNLSQHQGLFQWVSSSHKVARVLQFQLQHQSFEWIFRTDFL